MLFSSAWHKYPRWRCLLIFVAVLAPVLNYLFSDNYATFRSSLRPVWPHGYQHYIAHADLLDKIRYQMTISPPTLLQLTNDIMKIPKVVHLSWKTEYVPEKLAPWLRKWSTTNPDWTVIFWSDETMTKFVKMKYPSLYPVFTSYTVPVQRTDLFRYILLMSMGGVWADADVEPLKSLNPIRDMASCIVNEENEEHHQISGYFAFGRHAKNNHTLVGNAVMACRPDHPFIFFLLSKATERSPLVNRWNCNLVFTLWCTGPELVTQAYMFYKWSLMKRTRDKSFADDVIMTKSDLFSPTFDNSSMTMAALRANCQQSEHLAPRGQKICRELQVRNFRNRPLPDTSLTNHHWFHSYLLGENFRTVNIRNLLPNVYALSDDAKIVVKI